MSLFSFLSVHPLRSFIFRIVLLFPLIVSFSFTPSFLSHLLSLHLHSTYQLTSHLPLVPSLRSFSETTAGVDIIGSPTATTHGGYPAGVDISSAGVSCDCNGDGVFVTTTAINCAAPDLLTIAKVECIVRETMVGTPTGSLSPIWTEFCLDADCISTQCNTFRDGQSFLLLPSFLLPISPSIHFHSISPKHSILLILLSAFSEAYYLQYTRHHTFTLWITGIVLPFTSPSLLCPIPSQPFLSSYRH
jgi:hypothetical protein